MFEIYYQALRKDKPEFDEIPIRYQSVIAQTLKDELLIEAGRVNDLPPLTMIQRCSVIAYQKAQNRVAAERSKTNPHSEME